jgi:hypothetical protein
MLEYLCVISNGKRQITVDDLLNPEKLSLLIKEEVESVNIESQGVSRGAGGTGTSRLPLILKLRNGQETHIFVKTPTRSLAERAFFTVFGIYENEVKFYSKYFNQMNAVLRKDKWDIGPRVLCSKMLGCGKFVIILEDPRYREPSPAVFRTTLERPFPVEGSRTVLELLANMHAFYWNDAPKDIWHYCTKTGASLGTTPPFLLFLAYSAMNKIDKNYRKELNFYPDVREAFFLGMQHYHSLRAYWLSGKAITMTHGDAHMGNVFISNDALHAGFVDFQCVAVDHCMRDVSYHLINSCPAEELGAIEEKMIHEYLLALKTALFRQGKGQHVVDVPEYEEAYFQYRLHAFWMFIAWVMCCGFADIVHQDFVVASLQRGLDACHRLDILSAIKEALQRQKAQQLQSPEEEGRALTAPSNSLENAL